MTAIRQCATGKRCYSGHFAIQHVDMNLQKCSECGYYHTPGIKTEFSAKLYISACQVDPQRHMVYFDENLFAVERIKIDGEYVTFCLVNSSIGYSEKITAKETPVEIKIMSEVDYKIASSWVDAVCGSEPNTDINSRRNDELLASDIGKSANAANHEKEHMAPPISCMPTSEKNMLVKNAEFGERALDWMSGAIAMLKNREWAEQMPLQDAVLCDFESQISELVGYAGRFTEVQSKYAAACSTLESLGYTYDVEGEELWRPAKGDKPAYISWEIGEIDCPPPVGAKFIAIGNYTDQVLFGRVMGVGDENIIVKYSTAEEPEVEKAIKLSNFTFMPYSSDKVQRARFMAQIMNGGKPEYDNQKLKYALLVTHANEVNQGK